jgi:hypothetical protein
LLPHLWRKWRVRRKALRELRQGLQQELQEAMALGEDPLRLREERQREQLMRRQTAAQVLNAPEKPPGS